MEKIFSLKKKSINESEINKKSKKKLTIILAIIMIVLFVGVSFAAFYYNFTGNENLLNAESIELEVLESDSEIISITNALPMTDTQGIAQEETFDFAVTTRTAASTNIYYNLKIEKLAVDTGYTSLKDEDIRVYLTDYNNKALIGPIKISDLNNYTFYKTYNSHTSEATEVITKFKLKAWVDQDVDASDWNEAIKLQYKFKIGVTGNEYKSSKVNLSNKVIPNGAYYLSMDAETGAPTIQTEIPATVSENDMYVYGDYMYV